MLSLGEVFRLYMYFNRDGRCEMIGSGCSTYRGMSATLDSYRHPICAEKVF